MSEAVDWQVVDRALRGIATRRAALDSEEARWLREAEVLQIWRPLGMVSALDYMERVLGYAPRSAQERLRVARALGALPKLDAALAQGRLAFTAVRELTRVATPANEAAWLEAATGKNLRQIEELVADHRLGDGPTDPKDPAARTHVLRFELSASTYARLRQTRQALESERANSLSDDELIALLCEAALAGGDASEIDDGRAKFQVAMTVCERCRQGWQEGAGVSLPVDASTVERAMCDAQHLGSLDSDAPERAHQDVTPSVARFVRRRDGGRCRVPGCRSARGLEIHHIVHREDGGGHEAGNLILLCSSCHAAHHDGILKITGTAAGLDVERTHSKLDRAIGRARRGHASSGDSDAGRDSSKLDRGIGRSRIGRASSSDSDAELDPSELDRAIGGARRGHENSGDSNAEREPSELDRAIGRVRGGHARSGDSNAEREPSELDRGIGRVRGGHARSGDSNAEREPSELDRAIGRVRGGHARSGDSNAERDPSELDRGIGRSRSGHASSGDSDAGRDPSELDRGIGRARGHAGSADSDAERTHSELDRGIGRSRSGRASSGDSNAERELSKLDRGIGRARSHAGSADSDAHCTHSKLDRGIGRARSGHARSVDSDAEREPSKLDGGIGRARGAHVDARIDRRNVERDGSGVAPGKLRRSDVEREDCDGQRVELCRQVKQVLVEAGWSGAVASSAVAAASAKLAGEEGGAGASLERLLFEAFRACPRPRSR